METNYKGEGTGLRFYLLKFSKREYMIAVPIRECQAFIDIWAEDIVGYGDTKEEARLDYEIGQTLGRKKGYILD
jgi:hypothetical protein